MGWSTVECPGPDPSISESLGRSACSSCVASCLNKLESTTHDLETLKIEVTELQKDPLTGLLTRRAFLEEFEDYRADGRPFAIIFLDIENFSLFNDRYGHQGGDVILAAVGDAFGNNIRQTDSLALVE